MKYFVEDDSVKEGDIIYFDMPPFCSGNYKSKVYKDENDKLFVTEPYIEKCIEYRANKPYWIES